MKPSITILLPAYNEELNIPLLKNDLFPYLEELNRDYEVLIIDDGSTDKTLEEAKKLKEIFKQKVRIIKHTSNKGLGAAVRTGINKATKELIIPLDTDLTFHPKQIQHLVSAFDAHDVDCVIGSHLMYREGTRGVVTHRLFLSKIVNIIYRILLRQKIYAVSSIFRLYRTQDLQKLHLTSKGFNINAEILFKLIQENQKIMEVPAILTTRRFGESKLDTKKEVANHIKLIKDIMLWKLK